MRKFVWETPDEINMKVAEHAKNLRKRQGITQKRLSELTGVSYASIKRFEEEDRKYKNTRQLNFSGLIRK